MQERELKLLFDEGVLKSCVVVPALPNCGGYNVLFIRAGDKKFSLSLDTRPRKIGDSVQIRRFKTIDAACSLVSRQIGFKSFVVELY